MQFDNVVNTGHLLTAGAMIASAVGAVVWVQADLSRMAIEQRRLEAAFTTEVVAIRQEATAREGRLRAAELALAGQASDLRGIQASLLRIERLLEGAQR